MPLPSATPIDSRTSGFVDPTGRSTIEERFHELAANLPGVLYCYDYHADGRRDLHFLGPGLEELIGPRHAAQVSEEFDRLFQFLHPDDRSRVARTAADTASKSTRFDVECRLQRDDGAWVWVRAVSRGRRISDTITRWHVVVVDITAQKSAEERQRLLMRELDHRVKNNLATVLALAEHTSRNADSLDHFRSTFTDRIASMAAVHEALAQHDWSIDLRTLIGIITTPHTHGHPMRIEVPQLRLPARNATTVGHILHELSTNATKYGAFSAPDGCVSISCAVLPSRSMRLTWRESGGPPPADPCRPGTGFDLIRGLVAHDLRGTVNIETPPVGLVCEITAPISSIAGEDI